MTRCRGGGYAWVRSWFRLDTCLRKIGTGRHVRESGCRRRPLRILRPDSQRCQPTNQQRGGHGKRKIEGTPRLKLSRLCLIPNSCEAWRGLLILELQFAKQRADSLLVPN